MSKEAGSGASIGDLADALALAGLSRELADVGTTTTYDAALRDSHADGVGLVGDHVGRRSSP